jgi:hypothetical protein
MALVCSFCGCDRDDAPMICELCGAPLCHDCIYSCAYHACDRSVCRECVDWRRLFCNLCAPFVCPDCDEWQPNSVLWCSEFCFQVGCARCAPMLECELCGKPVCSDCGIMHPFTESDVRWHCDGCLHFLINPGGGDDGLAGAY